MNKNKLFTLMLAVVLVIVMLSLVACNNNDNDNSNINPVEYTVTFEYGGGVFDYQKIKSGEIVSEPTEPTKLDYDFKGWYNGETKYDFTLPVTKDLTLTAKWELSAPTTHVVTFDSDGGSKVESRIVNHNDNTYKPINPTRGGFYFEGWYLGDTKYDFSLSITKDITLKAKWSSVADVEAAFKQALSADYSNFTSANKISDEDNSVTDVFKQSGNLAYWESGTALYQDHLVIFGEDGKMLAMYYLNDGQWTKSNLSSYADFVLALDLDDISFEDVEYEEGIYYVAPESVASVIYALFRSTELYDDFYIQIENGHISKVGGTLSGGEVKQEQTFFAFGETEIALPELPAVNVQVETKNKVTEEGLALDVNELIQFMFNVKADDKTFAITADMVSFEDLNFADPAEGTYTATLTFVTWDGITHTETATVTVKSVQAEETFADVFAKDYSNVTISYINGSAVTTYKHIGDLYQYTTSGNNFYLFTEADGTLTRYRSNNNYAKELNQWLALPRLEILFSLNSGIFEQVEDTNIYLSKNNEAIEAVILKNMIMATNKLNKLRDYSIELTVTAGRVSKIVFSYYSLGASATATATNGTLRTTTYELSEFGTTEVTIPEEIMNDRETDVEALQSLFFEEDKKYIA